MPAPKLEDTGRSLSYASHASFASAGGNGTSDRTLQPVMHNIAHGDEIRKAYFRTEGRLAKKWPTVWGDLHREYMKVRYLGDDAERLTLEEWIKRHPTNEAARKRLEKTYDTMTDNDKELEMTWRKKYLQETIPTEIFWGTYPLRTAQGRDSNSGKSVQQGFKLPKLPPKTSGQIGFHQADTNIYKYRDQVHPVRDINKSLGWPRGFS